MPHLVLLLVATFVDPNTFALQGKWKELGKLLDGKKVTPASTEGEVSLYSRARVHACRANELAIADKLASVGARGEAACLAVQAKWDQVKPLVAAMKPLSDGDASIEQVEDIADLAGKAGRVDIAVDVLSRVRPSGCAVGMSNAVYHRNKPLAEALLKACPSSPDELSTRALTTCGIGPVDRVQLWQSLGANVVTTACLREASRHGDAPLVKFLVDGGAPADTDVLSAAIASNSADVVKLILAKGVDAKPVIAAADKAHFFGSSVDNETRARQRAVLQLLHGDQKAVLLVGGGDNAESAQQALETWKQVSPLAESLFDIPAGFPRIVESATIPGLKPGFHVVMLAAADEFELNAYLPIIAAIRPGSYVRKVTWSPDGGSAPLRLKDGVGDVQVHSKKLKGNTLSVVDAWKQMETTFIATLFDGKGNHLHSTSETMSFGFSCDGGWPVLVEDPTGFSLSAECDLPGCTAPNKELRELRISVKGNEIQTRRKEKLLHRGACD